MTTRRSNGTKFIFKICQCTWRFNDLTQVKLHKFYLYNLRILLESQWLHAGETSQILLFQFVDVPEESMTTPRWNFTYFICIICECSWRIKQVKFTNFLFKIHGCTLRDSDFTQVNFHKFYHYNSWIYLKSQWLHAGQTSQILSFQFVDVPRDSMTSRRSNFTNFFLKICRCTCRVNDYTQVKLHKFFLKNLSMHLQSRWLHAGQTSKIFIFSIRGYTCRVNDYTQVKLHKFYLYNLWINLESQWLHASQTSEILYFQYVDTTGESITTRRPNFINFMNSIRGCT